MSDNTDVNPIEEIRKSIPVVTSDDALNQDDKEIKNTEESNQEENQSEENQNTSENQSEEIDESNSEDEELDENEIELRRQKEKDRIQRRINKEVAARKAAEAKAAELERINEALRSDKENKLTEEDIKREAKRIAQEEKFKEQFEATCNKLIEDGTKLDKDFLKKVNETTELIGQEIPGEMIGILGDLDNGAEILIYLSDNIDEAEKIYSYPPIKMGVHLTKLSNKLEKSKETVKPKLKPISNLPEPNKPINGNSKPVNSVLTGSESMEDFVKIREKQVAERAKARNRW